MSDKLAINQWDEEDRPREKLIRLGAEALSNAELLAILIGSGNTEESAVALMRRLLNDCNNNLNTLGKMNLESLTAYKGMGPAKAVSILAACELGKRRGREKVEERPRIDPPQRIYELMHLTMQDLDVEEAWVLLLNNSMKLIKKTRLSHGGISETSVDVRILLKEALLNNATVVALCHNHPSQQTRPSADDDRLTKRVQEACKIMRIHFLDHVIVTDGNYYSYQENGRL